MAICEGLLAVRILALETSTNQASVALWESGSLQAEQCIVAERRIARFLLSTVQQVLDEHGWRPKDVQLVAVSQGPGSFTGLRVGLTTAKTFAYAQQVPVVGVNTLEVIAEQSFYPLDPEAAVTTADLAQPLAVVMNAHREQFFAATFAASAATSCQFMEATHLVDRESWLNQLASGCSVSGPGLSLVETKLPSTVTIVEPSLCRPRAAGVARLAERSLPTEEFSEKALRDQIFSLRPAYYRRSAAEEKRETG
ncbi:MAG: tRNA (adenosine(37)-N6)-threonylcarbamoyltransferase complex dimerization subunit type 1 TsaB [Planctomycetaceae bacterium]|nr:tRNA (adenosine(37)-N6)-threonylcarbamoyltransferase complex dimerization subunit type 1 TsaB [Planctomycetaceae bacterium]